MNLKRFLSWLNPPAETPIPSTDTLETVLWYRERLVSAAADVAAIPHPLIGTTFPSAYRSMSQLLSYLSGMILAIQLGMGTVQLDAKELREVTLDDYFLDDDLCPTDLYRSVQRLSNLIEELATALSALDPSSTKASYYRRALMPLYREIRLFSAHLLDLAPLGYR